MQQLTRGEAKRVRALSRRKDREAEGLLLAEGVRGVEELLAAGLAVTLAVIDPSLEETDRGRALAARLRSSAPVRGTDTATLRELADTETPQGVLVVAESPERALESIVPSAPSVVLMLDGVQDPGNLGTLARSAAAFGCDAMIVLPGTVDPWNPKAVRAAAGALFRVPVVRSAFPRLGDWLARHGYAVVGAEARGESVRTASLPERIALALGNEGAGLSRAVRDRCERRLSVPMRGPIESLNVAVAGAILLYELTTER